MGMLGYRSSTPMANAKGFLDTTGSVGSLVEVAMGQIFAVQFSAHINYVHDIYETGFGITTGV